MTRRLVKQSADARADLSRQLQPTLEMAAELLRDVARRFEFPYFHFGLRQIAGPGLPLQLMVDGGPPGFSTSVDLKATATRDALLVRAFAATKPFAWRTAVQSGDPQASELIGIWAKLGMTDGFTVPLHGPGGAVGALSLGATHPMPGSAHLRDELFKQAHWHALEAFDQITTAVRVELDEGPRQRPTSRQRQALALAACGHPLLAIAREMGVQPSTARYLISRAAEKLGVRSREEAIVRITAMDRHSRDVYPREVANQFVYYLAPPEPQLRGHLPAANRPEVAVRA